MVVISVSLQSEASRCWIRSPPPGEQTALVSPLTPPIESTRQKSCWALMATLAKDLYPKLSSRNEIGYSLESTVEPLACDDAIFRVFVNSFRLLLSME